MQRKTSPSYTRFGQSRSGNRHLAITPFSPPIFLNSFWMLVGSKESKNIFSIQRHDNPAECLCICITDGHEALTLNFPFQAALHESFIVYTHGGCRLPEQVGRKTRRPPPGKICKFPTAAFPADTYALELQIFGRSERSKSSRAIWAFWPDQNRRPKRTTERSGRVGQLLGSFHLHIHGYVVCVRFKKI